MTTDPTSQPMPVTESGHLIALSDVGLSYGSGDRKVDVLHGVDLSIDAGETVGVVGPSGSGKTSLLMMLGGLERATTGRVIIDGIDLSTLNEDRLAAFRRDRVGIVFQNFHLVPTMTALENVALPLEFAGVKDAFSRAEHHLDTVGLSHRTTHYPGQLSGGEQQRVALARAFAPEPKLLLADEPTGNLDEATGDLVMDLLFDLHRRIGTTLVLVTHAPGLAERCDRRVRVGGGTVHTEPHTDPANLDTDRLSA